MKQIAILGFGVVGGGCAELLDCNRAQIAARVGEEVNVKYILDVRDFPDSPYAGLVVHSFDVIEKDDDVSVVCEVIGGVGAAYEFTRRALAAKKNVVTSNKELVAAHGDELLALAKQNGVRYLFEASVGGGIPILRSYSSELAANDLYEIAGILNGTTNYILTKMDRAGASFDDALTEAQANGYAERDPRADVDGIDACRKTCILLATLTHRLTRPENIPTEGIRAVRRRDVAVAKKNGASVKLIGHIARTPDGYAAVVAPHLVFPSSPLAHVDDVFNAILVRGNFVGDVMYYGRGAGANPTASAVISDVIHLISGDSPLADFGVWTRDDALLSGQTAITCRRYLSCTGAGKETVASLFGDVTFLDTGDGEVTFTTAPLTDGDLRDKTDKLHARGGAVASCLRIFE